MRRSRAFLPTLLTHLLHLRAVLLVVFGLAVMMGVNPAFARMDGVSSQEPMQDGLATCSGAECHGDAATSLVEVSISGPTTLEPGESALYTIAIAELQQGGVQAGSGLNLALVMNQVQRLIDASLEQDPDFPDNLQVKDGEVTHVESCNVFPGAQGGCVGVDSFTVPVVAPMEEGALEIAAAMNSFNQNFDASGDHWNRDTLSVTVVPEPHPSVQYAAALLAVMLLGRLSRRRWSACSEGLVR